MAEPTDTLLADALAEYRAAPPPVAAHHTAGGIRTTVRHRRQVRAALWAVAVAVLVAVVPTLALAARHGHSPVQPATPPASVAPTPTAQPSPTSSPTTSPARTALDVYVPGTWLTPHELPFDSTYAWTTLESQPTLYQFPVSGDQSTCGGIDLAILGTGGMNHWQLWTFGHKQPGTKLVTAQVAAYQFVYPNVAAARSAFQRIGAQFPGCAHERRPDIQTGRPLVNTVTQLAAITDGFSFVHTMRTSTGQRGWTGMEGPDAHVYLVRRGRVIALIVVSDDPAIDRSANDQLVLQRMAGHLCRDGGSGADPLCR